MGIRYKIVLVVLPVLIASIVLVGASSYFSASSGISRVTRDFLGFKASELQKYSESQYQMLVDNKKETNPDLIEAAKAGIASFAKSIIRSKTEVIFTMDSLGAVHSQSSDVKITGKETDVILKILQDNPDAISTGVLGGENRVFKGFFFTPFGYWYVLTETSQAFYGDISAIATQTVIILIVSLLLSAVLLVLFAQTLTRPLRKVVDTMKNIIQSNDLSERVAVEFQDETGALAHTFNIMTGELDKAWVQIKSYALEAVLAQKREFKIRHIFQKFVPQEVINQFEAAPDAMLTGKDSELAILFSDIRSFTTISERMEPSDLVASLNRYFSIMVDIITERGGTVDKYIGDAIMAFFGAPAKHENDALLSVLAGIEMSEGLKDFNADQENRGKPPFNIGIGINYGNVTVGNIGTEKKMDYTIIGDNVNLGSRMEGLTKEYHQILLITESVQEKVKDEVATRFLDIVAVKGKTKGVRIFTAKKQLDDKETKGWALHNQAMELYLQRKFKEAIQAFNEAESHLPGDFNLNMIREACQDYLKNPPSPEWNGVRVMEHK